MEHLVTEMKRYGVSAWDIVGLLGCSEKTLRNKMDGTTGFTYREVIVIRDTFFPGISIEYLFDNGDSTTSRDPAA